MPSEDRTESKPAPATAEVRGERTRRWAIGLSVAYALYAIALGLIVPWAAREPIEREISALLGVYVDIERLSVNPFTLQFEVAGVEVRDERGGLLLAADALVANVDLLKSVVGVLRVGEIRLENVSVHGELSEEGELNLLALLPDDDGEFEEVEPEADDGGLFPVRVDEIHLVNGTIRLFDRSQKHLFVANVAPIDLAVHHISTVPNEKGRIRLEARGSRGLHLLTEFDGSISPLFARGELLLEGIRHNMIGDYLGPRSVVRPTAGELDIRAEFSVDLHDESGLVLHITRGGIEARGWEAESDLAEVQRVALDRFAIEGFRLGLAEREVAVEQIVLEGPRIGAVLPGPEGDEPEARSDDTGQADFDAAEGEPGTNMAAAAASPEPAWKLEIDRFAIAGGHVTLSPPDARDEVLVSVGPIDFEALGVSSVPDEDVELSLAVALPDDAATDGATARTSKDGPRLAIEGRLVPRPFEAELDVKAIEVALAPWSPLVGLAPGTRISSGRLDLTSSVKATTPEGRATPDVTVRADVDLRGFALLQGRGPRNVPAPVVRVGRVRAEGVRVADAGTRVGVSKVRVDSPSIYMERNERGELNLEHLMAPGAETPPEEPGRSTTVELRHIEVADGRLDYRDATTSRAFELDITDFGGSLERRKASDGASFGHIDFSARVAGAAPLSIEGGFPARDEIDVHVLLEGLSVTTLGPYFEQYVGSEVEQGKLYLDLDYELADRKIYGENEVRFDRIVFGKRTGSKDAIKLPVPLAFKLLTDTKGQTQLDPPPIKGDLDDPDFDLRSLVTAALIKVIQQALSSPLAVLRTAMPDFTADKQTQISFAAGSATLDATQREMLVNVATLLASEPEHRIAIKGRIDRRRDERALEKAGEEVDDERLRALGKARARAVRAELVDVLGLEAEHIFLRAVDLEGKAEGGFVPVDVVLTDD